jgi:ATP-binding cassette subfamily F protein 3
MERPVSALSGGWRVRVSLARALFVAPDCLLLDEPTNHLDLEACLWLEQYMCEAFDGRTVVVVSHDRSFLNAVCTDVLAIQNKKLTAYAGDFATYECVRDEQAERQQKMFDEQQAKKKQMQKFVDKHLHKGSTSMFDDGNAKKAKEMMKKMDRMGAMGHDGKKWKLSYDGAQKELTAPETEGGGFKFAFPDPGLAPGLSENVQLRDVEFTYGGAGASPLFQGLSFPIDCGTRLALVGKNGAGKSTLMKLIHGTLEPTRGNIFRSGKLRVSYVTQHHVDQLDLSSTPLEYVLRITGIERDASSQSYEIEDEQNARRRLGRFGISGNLQTQTISLLSGGQRSRVAWAVATSNDPHIILLDEPTNHLDYDSVNALIDACNAFEGGLVFVSHDEHFVTSVNNVDVLEVTGDGAPGAKSYADDFESYKRKALKALRKWIA